MIKVSDLANAVVVDYHADQSLVECVTSLQANGVDEIVVVENGAPGSTPTSMNFVAKVITPGVNLGYGRGVNRGAAALSRKPYLVVSNPDVVIHSECVAHLIEYLQSNPEVGIVGPTILRTDGTVYPSHRKFPNIVLAGFHALLAPIWPSNPLTTSYRSANKDGTVDWVSGAFFVVSRDAFEKVGGFDERYFMFAEDMALCWSLAKAGWKSAAQPSAVVTHVEGLSRSRAPIAMMRAHHRSALRFEVQSSMGLRKLLIPIAALVLAIRFALVSVWPSRHP
jgi:N-acetylglucosaminyl-diphospho-decaprenol L-rhamnosyltransferase